LILEIFNVMDLILHFLYMYNLDLYFKLLPSNSKKILWSNKFLKVTPCRN
jgi:hypothetical protein